MTVTLADLKPFFAELRRLGFKRDFKDRDVVIYYAAFPEHGSKVTVQLWLDGKHRASHYHAGLVTEYGVMDSLSSEFTTIRGMARAIFFEKSRYLDGVAKDVACDFG